MGAMSNTPGGCCCDVATWWYDIYQFDSRSPKHLVRQSCASKNDQPSDSFDGDQWFITPNAPAQLTPQSFQLYGYGSTTEKLWSVEPRGGIYNVVQYDCGAKLELSTQPVTTLGGPFPRIYAQYAQNYNLNFDPAIMNCVSANANYFAIVKGVGGGFGSQTATLEIVSGNATSLQTNIRSAYADGVDNGQIIANDIEVVHCLAPRSWPRVAGVSLRHVFGRSGPGNASIQYTTRFMVGDLSVIDFNPGQSPAYKAFKILAPIWMLDLTFTFISSDQDNFSPPASSNPRWSYFDANGDNWIGVIQWETFSKQNLGGNITLKTTPHIALVINGTVIKQFDDCTNFSVGTDLFAPSGPWDSVHAMFNGYLAVVATDYAVEPGPSFPSGQKKQPRWTRLRIYNGPALVWESPLASSASVYHSSDRWLYTAMAGMDFHDMPPCAFTFDIPRTFHTLNVRDHWLIRPDGTACAPMGVRPTDGSLPPELDTGVFAQHSPMYSPRLGFETIKHSDLIPDVPPAEPF